MSATARDYWVKIGVRSYKKNVGFAEAFIFGADRPTCLWAWAVYSSRGHAAWVENSFAQARKEADGCIASLPDSLKQGPIP